MALEQVLSAVITLWKIFVEIEHSPLLLKDFLTSHSRAKLVQLTILKLESENCDDWACECSHCFIEGKEVLHGISGTPSNCFLNNMAKNINSDRIQSHPKESGRKIPKHILYILYFLLSNLCLRRKMHNICITNIGELVFVTLKNSTFSYPWSKVVKRPYVLVGYGIS